MFPIRVSGVDLGGGSAPSGAAPKDVACSCGTGIDKKFGFPYGTWQPARLVEIVRRPYCSPVFGGTVIANDGATDPQTMDINIGGQVATPQTGKVNSLYHYHYYAFPITTMLNMFAGCNPDGMIDFDMMYLSEVDPTWYDGELAFFLNPEVTMFANPVAQGSCALLSSSFISLAISDSS
ncbi:MAG: TraU family protein [Zetaproteobacteria bacterium]|nr:TraU family protein [Zetaproteobacteria bacterium]